MRIGSIDLDVRVDQARRRLLAKIAGVLTGSAVALTFIQFGAARRQRERQES